MMRPGFITINQRQSRLQGNGNKELPTLTKFKVVPSASKVMTTVFWDMRGVLLVEFQEHGRTVNVSSYCSLLERLKTVIRTKRKGLLTQGVILLHE